MITYLLKMILVSGICWLWYLLALRNRKMHQYNRLYLLIAVGASLVIPLLEFNWFVLPATNDEATPVLYYLLNTERSNPLPLTAIPQVPVTNPVNWSLYISVGVVLIAIILSLVLFIRIYRAFKLAAKYPSTNMGEYTMVHTDIPEAPFSFFRLLFWRNDLTLNKPGCKEILEHELTHIRQKHSYDKLFFQLISAICWFNPFFWLIQREAETIHEFMADQGASNHTNSESLARMLLQAHYGNHFMEPSHFFFQSSIKRRFTMLNNENKPSFIKARRLMIIPVLFTCITLFSFSNTTNNSGNVEITATIAPDTTPLKRNEAFVVKQDKTLKHPGKGISAEALAEYNSYLPRINDPANKSKYNRGFSSTEVELLRKLYKDMNEQQRMNASFLLLPMDGPLKKNVPGESQYEKWKDASQYGVWINDKKVNNDQLNQYKPSDFSHFFASKIYGAAKKGRSYNVQLNLMTNDYYDTYVTNTKKSMKEKGNLHFFLKQSDTTINGKKVFRQKAS